MDYVPVYADEVGGTASGESPPPGLATVNIDPAAPAAHRPAHRDR